MPNRIIRDRILSSESLASLSHPAERLFYRLIVLVDDHGRFHGSANYVRAAAMGLLKVSVPDVGRWLVELVDARVICIYEVEGRPYLQFVNWPRYQRLRAKQSKFPVHAGCECGQVRALAVNCAQMSSGTGNGDGIGIGEKKERPSAGSISSAGRRLERLKPRDKGSALYAAWPKETRQRFDRFWDGYANKVAKAAAVIAWEQLGPPDELLAEKIIRAAFSQRQEWNRKRVPVDKTPHPATWLNGGRWEDELPSPAAIAAQEPRVVL